MRGTPTTVVIRQVVRTEDFISGAADHIDGLAGYVRRFLKKNGGRLNEYGREWTSESCANALKIPAPTLRRWIGEAAPDQEKPAPLKDGKAAVTPEQSNTKKVLSDAAQRRAVVAALPPEVRDELRADLIDLDMPRTAQCRHCPSHCPEGSH